MAKPEVYVPIPSVPVEGFTHSEIQGTLATTKYHPFQEGHIGALSCVSVNKSKDSNSHLMQISSLHGRAYELSLGEDTTVIWEDEYGNIFSKLNTKGNNCTSPGVYASSTAPSGFLFYGMQENDAIVRVLRASDLLRSHHIETEVILKVIEPATLPFRGRNIPLQEFKRKLVQKIWREDASEGETDKKLNLRKATREQLPKLATVLDDATLLITVRGLQVSERLADLYQADREGKRKPMLDKAFRFVNLSEEAKARKDKSYAPQYFSLDQEGDLDRYFTDYLPRKLAHNFAALHELGLVHYFPHTGNISIVGSFYDLDSVRGEPLGLGDALITHTSMLRDLDSFLNNDDRDFPTPGSILVTLINHPARFGNNFLRFYIEEMDLVRKDVEQFTDVCLLFDTTDIKDKIELVQYFNDQMINHAVIGPDDDIVGVFRFVGRVMENFEGSFEFYHQLLQKLDLDKDIAGNIVFINDLFDGFSDMKVSPQYLGFYLERLSKELDWDFVMEETLEEMIDLFHKVDQETARHEIELCLQDMEPEDSREKVIELALEFRGEEGWPSINFRDRYIVFGWQSVDKRFDEVAAEKMTEWAEKYGEETAKICREWFTKKYCDKFINYYSEEVGQEIERVGTERIERLKQEFLSN